MVLRLGATLAALCMCVSGIGKSVSVRVSRVSAHKSNGWRVDTSSPGQRLRFTPWRLWSKPAVLLVVPLPRLP